MSVKGQSSQWVILDEVPQRTEDEIRWEMYEAWQQWRAHSCVERNGQHSWMLEIDGMSATQWSMSVEDALKCFMCLHLAHPRRVCDSCEHEDLPAQPNPEASNEEAVNG